MKTLMLEVGHKMDAQKSKTALSMVLGAGFGLIVCALSFAIVGTISAIVWIELIPPRLPVNSLINFVFLESPVQIGTIPGAILGAVFGLFWGAFDSQLGEFALRLIRRDFDLGGILHQMILVIVLGSVLLSLIGVFVTTSLWHI